MTRFIVTGGRDFEKVGVVWAVLDTFAWSDKISCIINGACPTGVDALANSWATSIERFPADWRQHGKSAGMIRNEAMARDGHAAGGLVFPGGPGTAHMLSMLRKYKIPRWIVRPDAMVFEDHGG